MSLEDETVIDDPIDVTPEVTPEVTPQVTPEVKSAEPTSMEDTLRAKFREMSKTETPADPDAGRARGPDGKFIKADGTPEEPAIEPAKSPDVAIKPPEAPVVVKPGEFDISKPPTSLKGNVQAKWAALDPDVKTEFHRREADFHKGIGAYKEMADIGKLLDAEIRPYEAMIRAANATPQSVIREFMNTAYQLKTGTPEVKTQLLMNIAEEYGIDLTNLQAAAEQLAVSRPQVDPRVAQLEQQLGGITKMFEDQKRTAMQQEYAVLQNETQAFSQKPENRFYEQVKLDMAALIESGRAEGLQDAYDKAVWANPEARAVMLAEQQATERKQKADKAALARKAASTNVTPRGTLPAAPVVGTMEDTLRATFRRLNGA